MEEACGGVDDLLEEAGIPGSPHSSESCGFNCKKLAYETDCFNHEVDSRILIKII